MTFDSGNGDGGGDTLTVTNINDTDSPYDASDNEVVVADASSGAITINLPAPSDNLRIVIKVENAANNVTVSRNGSENIDGSASDLTLKQSDVTRGLISDGTDWWVLNYDAKSADRYLAESTNTNRNNPQYSFEEDSDTGFMLRVGVLEFIKDGSTWFSMEEEGALKSPGDISLNRQGTGAADLVIDSSGHLVIQPGGTEAMTVESSTETGDGMTADPETGTEDAFLTVSIGTNTYQIPLYSA